MFLFILNEFICFVFCCYFLWDNFCEVSDFEEGNGFFDGCNYEEFDDFYNNFCFQEYDGYYSFEGFGGCCNDEEDGYGNFWEEVDYNSFEEYDGYCSYEGEVDG